MIPALTLVAINAPEGRRATWFALMASLMNVALVAAQLQTKYLNYWYEVGRGSYAELPMLTIVAVTIGFIVPVAGIIAFGLRASSPSVSAPREPLRFSQGCRASSEGIRHAQSRRARSAPRESGDCLSAAPRGQCGCLAVTARTTPRQQ
jgi:hypothetical protein